VLGANSLLETGNMGFGKRALFAFRQPLFLFLEKEAIVFYGQFFRLVLSYSQVDSELTEYESE
jgi:hypothetical protein